MHKQLWTGTTLESIEMFQGSDNCFQCWKQSTISLLMLQKFHCAPLLYLLEYIMYFPFYKAEPSKLVTKETFSQYDLQCG